MIDYLKEFGYRQSTKNDLRDRQFYLERVNFTKGVTTSFSNFEIDYSEDYTLFLKHFESVSFKSDLDGILQTALDDGLRVNDVNVDVICVENGYEIKLKFIYKG